MVEEVHGPGKVFQGEQVVRGVFPRKLDIINPPAVADDFGHPGQIT